MPASLDFEEFINFNVGTLTDQGKAFGFPQVEDFDAVTFECTKTPWIIQAKEMVDKRPSDKLGILFPEGFVLPLFEDTDGTRHNKCIVFLGAAKTWYAYLLNPQEALNDIRSNGEIYYGHGKERFLELLEQPDLFSETATKMAQIYLTKAYEIYQ